MPWGVFKIVKVKCNLCNDIVISRSDKDWSSCSCGSTKVMGVKSFKRIDGNDYTDLSVLDFSNVPEHRDWEAKPGDYNPYANGENA